MAPGDRRAPFGADEPAPRGTRSLGREGRRAGDLLRRLRALAVLMLLLVSGLVIRRVWQARSAPAPAALVEVQGAVPSPGIYELPEGTTVRQAFAAAGADPVAVLDPFADLPVYHGYRVLLLPDGSTRVWLTDERLLVGLPLDPNTADADLLEQLPGIGPARAAAIVDERRAGGPFAAVDDLIRVRGIGPATLDELRPFLGIDGIGAPEEQDQETSP